MTVKELKAALEGAPDDAEVWYDVPFESDCGPVECTSIYYFREIPYFYIESDG